MSSPDDRPTPTDPRLRGMALPIAFVTATALALGLLPLMATSPNDVVVAAVMLLMTTVVYQNPGIASYNCMPPYSGPVLRGGAAGGMGDERDR